VNFATSRPETSPISRNFLILQRCEKPNPSPHNHLIMGNPGIITLQIIPSGLDTTMTNSMKGL
jgi:hypothetical protein